MFNFSGSEIVFLLLLALIVLGPEKLPEAVRRFGKTYAEFKKVTTGFQTELKQALDEPMREMRETADAFKKAATLDVDTSVFKDPFGRAVSSADQKPTVEPDQATLGQAVPGPAPVPSASDAPGPTDAPSQAAAGVGAAGNEPPLAPVADTGSPSTPASTAGADDPTDGAAPA